MDIIPYKLYEAFLTLMAVLIGGAILTPWWTLWQKRRATDIAVLSDLNACCSKFIALQQLLNNNPEHRHANEQDSRLPEEAAELLGRIDAVLIKATGETQLNGYDLQILGLFRQTFCCLCEAISEGRSLTWSDENDPLRKAFYNGALALESVLSRPWQFPFPRSPSAVEAAAALRAITSSGWKFETKAEQQTPDQNV